MNKDNKLDGGSAFPAIYGHHDQDGGLSIDSNGGMTLLDYFAGQVLVGIMSDVQATDRIHQQAHNNGKSFSEESSAICYNVAKDMLKERAK